MSLTDSGWTIRRREPRAALNRLLIVKAAYGMLLLGAAKRAPGRVARGVDLPARVVAGAVGARNLVEAVIVRRRPTPAVIGVVAAVDATHAASMLIVAAARPDRRRLATASAVAAGVLAGAAVVALRSSAIRSWATGSRIAPDSPASFRAGRTG